MERLGCNMTPFFLRLQHFLSKNANFIFYETKCINTTETGIKFRDLSQLKCCFVFRVCQSLIKRLF